MNSIDTSGKIKLSMSVANNNSILEFLYLSLYSNEHNKICVDAYAKPTNSSNMLDHQLAIPKKEH